MILKPAEKESIPELVRISKEAFDSDIAVGASGAGGPPEYDSIAWHIQMMNEGHLYEASEEGNLVGGAILFKDRRDPSFLYIGRIFVDPKYFRNGYGARIMELIEQMDQNIKRWVLDTPAWNTRTNRFYQKLGYTGMPKDDEFILYQKTRD